MGLRTCAALLPRPERLGFELGRDDGGVAVGTEDAVAGVEALDGEEAQAGSGGGAIGSSRVAVRETSQKRPSVGASWRQRSGNPTSCSIFGYNSTISALPASPLCFSTRSQVISTPQH